MSLRGSGRPETKFCETGRGEVAYQVFGEGDRDIIFLTHWLTNVDMFWDEPSAVRYFDRLSSMGRVIMFDKLATGVSDMSESGQVEPIELQIDDTLTVMSEVGSESATLIGDTEGGMLAMILAATHPDKFQELVLINSYAKFRRAEDYPIGAPDRVVDRLRELWIAQHGTTGALLAFTAPSMLDDQRFTQWLIRFQRAAQKPRVAEKAIDWVGATDVRAILPLVQARTAVIHRRDALHHRLPFGEYLAENIEGAEFTIVEGMDTIPFHAGDFGPTLDAVEEFLTGHSEVAATNRMLATVLFTDIVDSTAIAAEMGDERWLDLLTEHDRIVRNNLDRFRGDEVAMTGDGAVATFDGPQRAIMCATAIKAELETIGLRMRAGVHTGEIETRGSDVGGIGVHIASRVMSQAETGGILVSSTVKDLVVGSNLDFTSCGAFDLKGVPGSWNLYQVGD